MNADLENENAENVEERLLKWLGEEGFIVEELGGVNTTYNFWVTKSGLPSFSVFQPKGKHDVVYVESGLTFSGLEEEALSVIVDDDNSLSWELKSHLLLNGFTYKIQRLNQRSKKPGGMIFAKTIYYDGLSKDRFLETINQTLSTVKVIILTIRRHVNKCGYKNKLIDKPIPYVT